MSVGRRISATRAAEILHRLFGRRSLGVAFRLWDGTPVTFEDRAPVCTAVIHRPETFIRLVRNPSPLTFAEAYVDGAIDLEGDLFAAMSIANAIEGIRVPLVERVKILVALWRG
jgi:cyclopropane-fatty-acyl-phospholipid synthase